MQYIDLLSDLAYGAAIGGALGLTGTGGSILAIPALIYFVGQDVHTAIGTSLAVVGGIAAEGMIGQRDSVQWEAGLLLGACGIAGSIPGSLLSPYVSSPILMLLFSGLAVTASVSMLLSQRGHKVIGVSRNSGNRTILDSALAQANVQIEFFYEVNHLTTSSGLVERGLGISVLPKLATPPSGHPTIVTKSIGEPLVKRTIGLIERRSARLSPAAQKFRDMLAER